MNLFVTTSAPYGYIHAMSPVEPPEAGLNAAVAAELRAERAAQDLTVQELADMAGIPFGSLRRYLAAERNIDVATLAALAAALGTTSGEIVAAAEERMARRGRPVVIEGRFGTSDPAPTVSDEELAGYPSAAEPERRDDGTSE